MYAKIAFRKRGPANKFAIEQDELVDQGDGELLTIKRGPSEQELPYEVRLVYMDIDADYQQGAQYTRRLTGIAKGSVSLEMPLVTTADHAKLITEVNLYLSWLCRQQYVFATDQRYAHIEPTDAGTINCDGYTHTVRITKKDEQVDGSIKFEAVADDTTIYQRGELAVPMPPRGQYVRGISPALPLLLDIPMFRFDAVALQPGVYFVATPVTPGLGWEPSVLAVSRDGGYTWTTISQSDQEPTYGMALEALGPGPTGAAFIPDESSEVTVYIEGGRTLADTDHNGLIEMANLALLGDEIIAFRDVQALSGNQYRLTGLLRGLFGTEYAMSTHIAYDRFVMLDSAVRFAPLYLSDAGLELKFAALRVNENPVQREPVTFVWTAEILRPRAPVTIGAGRNAAGDITVTWTARTRIPGTLIDDQENLAPEDLSPSYAVEIWDTAFTERKRTLYSSSMTTGATYTVAEQTSDFGGVQTEIGVQVYQISLYGSPGLTGRPGREILRV